MLNTLKNNKNLDFRVYEYGRALADYNSEKSTCLFNRRVSSIFKDAKYSSPVSKYESRELFFRTDTLHQKDNILNSNGFVDLKKLFSEYPERILLVGQGLTYGDELDSTIKILNTKNSYFRVPSGHSGAFVKMLMQDKVDYILEYKISFDALDIDASKYSSLKISNEEYTTGHLVCNYITPDEVIKIYEDAIIENSSEIFTLKKKFKLM